MILSQALSFQIRWLDPVPEILSIALRILCAYLLRTIFASSARAHERVHVQNVRDFSETKRDNGINSPFLLNEYGNPRFSFQVFAKNSLMKNIFEEKTSLIVDLVEHDFFWKIVPNWAYFRKGEDFKLTMELSKKVQLIPATRQSKTAYVK